MNDAPHIGPLLAFAYTYHLRRRNPYVGLLPARGAHRRRAPTAVGAGLGRPSTSTSSAARSAAPASAAWRWRTAELIDSAGARAARRTTHARESRTRSEARRPRSRTGGGARRETPIRRAAPDAPGPPLARGARDPRCSTGAAHSSAAAAARPASRRPEEQGRKSALPEAAWEPRADADAVPSGTAVPR